MTEGLETLLYQLIGERVRARRGSLTQTQLAERVGLGRTSITNLESGAQRMPLHYLVRIAEALDADVCDFIPTREELAQGGPDVVLGVTGEVGRASEQLIKRHFAKVPRSSKKNPVPEEQGASKGKVPRE